jgi:hypothetical protein
MSEFYAKAASSTFHVRDARALRTALDGLAIIVYPATGDGDPNHVYLVSEQDKGCWPSERFDDDSREGVEVDLLALIAEHLKPGEAAVLKEASSEKASYIGARASAVNDRGETATVDLDEIYERATVLAGQLACDV